MTDRDRLIELICDTPTRIMGGNMFLEKISTDIADYLLANGVIVAPMPMADWLKQELTEYVHERCMEEL